MGGCLSSCRNVKTKIFPIEKKFDLKYFDIESINISVIYCLGNISEGKDVSFCFDTLT